MSRSGESRTTSGRSKAPADNGARSRSETSRAAADRAVADATDAGGLRSVAGGGDTVSALRHAGAMERMSYVSTAGGAFLEWLEGKVLPGIAALEGTIFPG